MPPPSARAPAPGFDAPDLDPDRSAQPSSDLLSARDRILLAAHDLFYREGIRATGIDRVIAASRVAKASFYRHFPAKDDLILAYLEYRHQRWMAWFAAALQRHGGAQRGASALVPALAEWLKGRDFRGCAFINGVSELGTTQPAIRAIAHHHKHELAVAIEALLTDDRHRSRAAQALVVAIDGAIVRAQIDDDADAALAALQTLVDGIVANARAGGRAAGHANARDARA